MIELLVVDDQPEVRRMVRRILRNDGYLFREASDGEEALELLADRPAALIVMDCSMPRMGGEQALAALRQGGCLTPVIMMSGVMDEALVRRLVSLGAACCFPKLELTSRLAGAVREALGSAGRPS